MKIYNKYFVLGFFINSKGVEGIEKNPAQISPAVSSHIMHLSGEELWRTGNGSEIWQGIENDKKLILPLYPPF